MADTKPSTKPEPSKPNAYIILPASVSGDLWHVAAAKILADRYSAPNFNHNIVIVVACSTSGAGSNEKQLKDQRQFGSVSFSYFQKLGLKPVVIQCRQTNVTTKNDVENILFSQPAVWFDAIVKEYRTKVPAEVPFDVILENKLALVDHKRWDGTPWINPDSRVLKLMTATTLAMNFLCNSSDGGGVRGLVVKERFEALQSAMCQPDEAMRRSEDAAIEELAEKKYQDLLRLITKAKEDTKSGKVVLENYRKNLINQQTDSNPELSKYFGRLAKAKNMAVVTVLAAEEKDYKDLVKSGAAPYVLDLYNKLSKQPYPGLDSRAQCLFWSKVKDNPDIYGIIGGRSGSIDLAGFMGVNAFFWDEPWIEWSACNADIEKLKLTGNVDSDMQQAQQQVSQCLRSLQLLAIMSVGIATVKTKDNENWAELRGIEIQRWFEQERSVRGLDPNNSIYPVRSEAITKWKLPKSVKFLVEENLEVERMFSSHVLRYFTTNYWSILNTPKPKPS